MHHQEYLAFGEDTHTCRLQASLRRLRGVCEADSWNEFHEPLLNGSCIYMMRYTASYICRNIEAVTTRRSWKPFAQKARGFESLFLRHKNEHHPSWMVFIFISQSEGTNPKGSHTAGTEHTTRNRLFAVSASRGDVGLNLYRSGTISTNLTPSSIPLFRLERILTPLCDSQSRRMGYCRSRYSLRQFLRFVLRLIWSARQARYRLCRYAA